VKERSSTYDLFGLLVELFRQGVDGEGYTEEVERIARPGEPAGRIPVSILPIADGYATALTRCRIATTVGRSGF